MADIKIERNGGVLCLGTYSTTIRAYATFNSNVEYGVHYEIYALELLSNTKI